MKANGIGAALGRNLEQTPDSLSYVTWQTGEAVALPGGAVWASGDASLQVRSPKRLAALGDAAAQAGRIRQVIVAALTDMLQGMAPSLDDLDARRDEIASLTLVAANMKLSALGASLLDLRIDEMTLIR
jgi:hypothetical protein